MVRIKGLKKSYKLTKKQIQRLKTNEKVVIAVNDLSLDIHEGEIFGLLGPNGAGKTTALRCIATLLKPTDGTVEFMGEDVTRNPMIVRKNIAFLTNELRLDKHFTVEYTADFFGGLYGLDSPTIEKRKTELFRYFDIEPFRHKRVGELSTGMMQKLSIVVSCIHDPKVVIFDEPTNGLDIITARRVIEFLRRLKAQGKTVIVSTHIMSVAEKLCDRVAIILDGKAQALGTCEEIANQYGGADLEEAFFNLYQNLEERKQVVK